MAFQRFSGTFQSSNKKNRIHYYIFEPETDLRAILQVCHDVKEYIGRHKELIKYFTDHGVMLCGIDMIGHGDSSLEEDYGYFGESNGWSHMVKDTKKLTHYIKREYPDNPLFLYGHGMGSLVARLCVLHDDSYKGLIVSGVHGKVKYCKRTILLTALLKRLKGVKYRSKYMEDYFFNQFNKKFTAEEDPYSWFSTDKKARLRYGMDKKCQPVLAVSAYEDIFKMIELVSAKSWYRSLSQKLPVLILSGQEDPIGDFGKGAKDLCKKLDDTEHDAHIKLYEGMRHEIQDENYKENVFDDILYWMKKYILE